MKSLHEGKEEEDQNQSEAQKRAKRFPYLKS